MPSILALPLFFSFFFPLSVWSQAGTIIADYEELIQDKKKQTMELRGSVNIIFQTQHLTCEYALIDEKSQTITAEGNVVLQNGQTTIRGSRIKFNYETSQGKIFNGLITSGQILIEAPVIEKVGRDEYVADDAYYTACNSCPASWGFTSRHIKADIGGHASIYQPWLHLLQFPLLPLPYLEVPLNSRRQTGFLVPRPFSNRDGGLILEQPFFWAISRSQDATFSLINYEKRGLQATANYRYVLSNSSSGGLNTGFLRDQTVSDPEHKNRWFLEYKHHYEFSQNLTQRTQLEWASDRKYAFDFFQQFQHNGDPALESRVSLTKAFENSLLTIEGAYYLSQIEPQRDFRNERSLHRLPEVNYQLQDTKVSDELNLFFNLEAQYLNITGPGQAFEHTRSGLGCQSQSGGGATPGNGTICHPQASSDFIYGSPLGETPQSPNHYGDLIRTGQRLDLKPQIHAPFWWGDFLNLTPSLSLRYTQYALGVPSDPSQGYDAYPSRFYGQLGLEARSELSRIYNWNKQTRVKHSLLPEMKLNYIPQIWQSRHNFFGNSKPLLYSRELQPIDDTDGDWRNQGRGIQFDHRDRVIGKQFMEFGFTNKIIYRNLMKKEGLSSPYTPFFLFGVYQALDLDELQQSSDDPRPWQSLNTRTELNLGPFSQRLRTQYYPYHHRTVWDSSSRFTFPAGSYLQVGYTKNYNIPLHPPVDENTKREFLYLSTGVRLPYTYLYGQTSVDLNPKGDKNISTFQQWTLAMELIPPGSCWNLNAQLVKTLSNENIQPSLKMNFKFD